MKRILLPALLVYADHLAAEIPGNLITNGDFESGNTGFQSDYYYVASGTNQAAGEYLIVTELNNAHPYLAGTFGNMKAYGGSGYYMFANGASSTTDSPWKATLVNPTVTLTTNVYNPVYYRFEAQVANINGPGGAPPGLSFEISINGGAFNTFVQTPQLNVAQQWTMVYVDTFFFTSQPSSVALRLRNTVTADSGNDFALDNIYFGLRANAPSFLGGTTTLLSVGNIANPGPLGSNVPEPSTYGLVLGGLALAVVAVRRRAKVKTKV